MTELNDENFPGNSRRAKEEALASQKPLSRKLTKVISGKVIRKEKPFYKKIGDLFFGKDTENVVSYIWWDILIPAAKDLLVDSVKKAVEMRVYGETRRSDSRSGIVRDRGRSYVNYGNYGRLDRDQTVTSRIGSDQGVVHRRAKNNWEDIILESRSDAEEVLASLLELIDKFEVASISDLCELIEIDSEHTDSKYGWTNLSKATVERVRNGYLLNLPTPYPI